ncbi:response regulator transcription factor [Sphingomonas sp. BGYR3]|uniref:response regulator transcription factor n=1 Tax=Sphingomonas sp. BGYR3 TaxID=2975483 RepID=UPI0021A757FF|nr:response regulator transcription factor [Sphingomonas sp. BGYR3]
MAAIRDAPEGLAEALARRGHRLADADASDGLDGVGLVLARWTPAALPAAGRLAAFRALGWHGPVMLILTAGGGDAVAEAIDAGAADAVTHTADLAEIAARASAILRTPPSPVIGLGGLTIDPVSRAASRDGRPLDLLPREYALLLHLARHAGQCIERTALLAQVWGLRFDPGTNVVAVHVSRLRAKLDRQFDRPMLLTEKGRGYRLVAD